MNLSSPLRAWMLVLAIALLHVSPVASLAQTAGPDSSKAAVGRFGFRVGAGFTTIALSDAKNFFEDILRSYQVQNITIEAQRTYPGNLTFGLDLHLSLPVVHELGVGAWYTWTSAYARYGDYSGTLDLISHVRLLSLQLSAPSEFRLGDRIKLLLESRAGVGICWYELNEEVQLTYMLDTKSTASVEASGAGFTGDLYGGLVYEAGAFEIFVKAGYRYARFSDLKGDFRQSDGASLSGPLGFRVDMSGVMLVAGLAMNL